MNFADALTTISALLPILLMGVVALRARGASVPASWTRFRTLAAVACLAAIANLGLQLAAEPQTASPPVPGLLLTLTGAWMALLVQVLGTVIGVFSSRYLQGEPRQDRYVAALGGVLASVHVLLLADHWLVLIAAWAVVGLALQHLLCFYDERPFARLAAHKKHLADRLADLFLLVAAALAWHEVGSGSFSDLKAHLATEGASVALQASAVLVALAVVLRTALMPMHGWLIQVMEAPTPVSALLHAGVINLGGFVLIRLAPLLEAAPAARWLLVGMGLTTALLAGFVMLTRISIKVRLAWSTAAQMGFMVMECGLGLYSLAMLHLIGHSLYKAHTFLAASTAVEQAQLRTLRGDARPSTVSLLLAPVLTAALVAATLSLHEALTSEAAWPWWWSGVLVLAWAPLLWHAPRGDAAAGKDGGSALRGTLMGAAMVVALVLAALIGHALPLGAVDAPDQAGGLAALAGMACLYVGLTLLHARPASLATWRRWSYAGFYLDEYATRAALRLWPTPWAQSSLAVISSDPAATRTDPCTPC